MIKLATNCNECIHAKVCRNKYNTNTAMEKLKNMQFGKGPNDDYTWDTIMNFSNVDILFSCPDFLKISHRTTV